MISGQYASEGEGLCLDCKNEGEKFYADTNGSSSCKICDGEVDTKRKFCAMHQDGAKPAPDNANGISTILNPFLFFSHFLTSFELRLSGLGKINLKNLILK